MYFHPITKWTVRLAGAILILIILATVALYWFFNYTTGRIYGGQTTQVDPTQFNVDAGAVAITNVNVLSPDGTEMLPGRTVLLDKGKIVAIVATETGNSNESDSTVPDGFTSINGEDKYLIPGLMDSHVHLHRSPNDLLLYIANGVTQVRSMGGSEEDLALKHQIEDGRVGPHFYVSTPSMNSVDGFDPSLSPFPSWMPGSIAIWLAEGMFNIHISENPDKSAEAARSFINSKYDGIKLYGFLTMENYRAILDVAEELDVPTVGHLPDSMHLNELKTTKLGEIAHIEEIVKALQREFESVKHEFKGSFIEYVQERTPAIIADLVTNDIAVQSTLWLSESFSRQVFELEEILADIPLEYANPGIVEGYPGSPNPGWLPGSNKFQTYAGTTPEERAGAERYWEGFTKAHHLLFRAMVDANVTVLAGTDANAWLTIPGFSLHNEIESLTEAGMTPSQAINAATAAPAKILNTPAGVIDEGRRADLVLLERNPLIDIANTRSIDTVILNGKVLNRAALDAMLASVREANASSRKIDISPYQ